MKRIGFVVALIGILFAGKLAVSANCDEAHYVCNDNNVFNGYWWSDRWVPFYPTLESWFRPTPVWAVGNAVYYEPGPMGATAKWRSLSLKGFLGAVSLIPAGDIGETIWMNPDGRGWEGPYLVVDSASRGDIYPVTQFRNEVVEVDWSTAIKWGLVSPSGTKLAWRLENVQISKLPPAELTGCPIDFPRWWLAQAKAAEPEWVRTPVYVSPRSWKINGDLITFESPTKDDLLSEQVKFEQFLLCEEDVKHRPPR